jgi:hypothetical protein
LDDHVLTLAQPFLTTLVKQYGSPFITIEEHSQDLHEDVDLIDFSEPDEEIHEDINIEDVNELLEQGESIPIRQCLDTSVKTPGQ